MPEAIAEHTGPQLENGGVGELIPCRGDREAGGDGKAVPRDVRVRRGDRVRVG